MIRQTERVHARAPVRPLTAALRFALRTRDFVDFPGTILVLSAQWSEAERAVEGRTAAGKRALLRSPPCGGAAPTARPAHG